MSNTPQFEVQGIVKIDKRQFDNLEQQVRNFDTNLKKALNIQIPNLTGIDHFAKSISKASKTLEDTKLSTAIQSFHRLNNIANKLDTTLQSVAKSMKAINGGKGINFVDNRGRVSNKFDNRQYAKIGQIEQWQGIKATINQTTKASKKYNDSIKQITTNTKQLNNTAKNSVENFASIFKSLGGLRLLRLGIKKTTRLVSETLNESANWYENLNLFEVAFNEHADKMLETFVNISDRLSTSLTDITRYAGVFKQMATSIGIADTASTHLSESLTILAYDYASLYNIKTFKIANEKLRSAIAGQVKPVRQEGQDITAQSLEHTVEEFAKGNFGVSDKALKDIEKSFNLSAKELQNIFAKYSGKSMKDLSQGQKMMLRAIRLMQGTKNAHGDLAKTINSYANQQKLLRDNFKNLKLAIGDSLITPMTKLLYIFNGLIQATTSFVRAITGHSLTKTTALNDGVKNIHNSFKKTNDEIKIMKNGLASIDKFNVLGGGDKQKGEDDEMTKGLEAMTKAFNLDAVEKFNEKLQEIDNKARKVAETIRGFFTTGKKKKVEKTDAMGNKSIHEVDELNSLGIAMKGITKVAGGLMAGLLGAGVIANVVVLVQKLGLVKHTIAGVGKALSFLVAHPIIAITAGVVVLLAKLYKHNEQFRNSVKTLFKNINEIIKSFKPFFEALETFVSSVLADTMNILMDLLAVILIPLADMINVILEALKPIFDLLGNNLAIQMNLLSTILIPVMKVIATVIKIISNVTLTLFEALKTPLKWIVSVLEKVFNFINKIATKINNSLVGAIKNIIGVFKDFFDTLSLGFKETIKQVKSGGERVGGKIADFFVNGIWGNAKRLFGGGIKAYANGGVVNRGELFIANEQGPELVANIGGSTAVANNDMIVQAIENATTKGIIKGLASADGNQTITLNINTKTNELARVLFNDLLAENEHRGKPLVVGV